jgi:hypothetical protein
MLDTLIDSVKGQVIGAITEKTGLDVDQAQRSIPVAKESVTEGVTAAITGGNVGGILDMLKSAAGSGGTGNLIQNTVYKGIAAQFISKVTSALGIPESMAQQVASVALPMILSKLGGAAQSAGDSDEIDQRSVLEAMGLDAGSLLGKAGGELGKKLGGLGGLFK